MAGVVISCVVDISCDVTPRKIGRLICLKQYHAEMLGQNMWGKLLHWQVGLIDDETMAI